MSHNTEQIDSEKCPICLSDLLPNEQIKKLECGHSLHDECFMNYGAHQQNNNQQLQCMVCRTPINSSINFSRDASEIPQAGRQPVDNQDVCFLCKRDLLLSDHYIVSPCGHGNFHANCIQGWFERQASYRSDRTCPICSQEIS